MVIELRMYYCGEMRKADIQNHLFGWLRFEWLKTKLNRLK